MGTSARSRPLYAEPITTERLVLEPLTVKHADELVEVLDNQSLHTYVGGTPANLAQLRGRFDLKAGGVSADGVQTWLNWVIRDAGAATGFVQATVTPTAGGPVAELAWVVGVAHQRQGLATESAAAVVQWLAGKGVRRLVAHVHPDNTPSAVVATRLGLRPTTVVVDGEVEWVSRCEPPGGP